MKNKEYLNFIYKCPACQAENTKNIIGVLSRGWEEFSEFESLRWEMKTECDQCMKKIVIHMGFEAYATRRRKTLDELKEAGRWNPEESESGEASPENSESAIDCTKAGG